MKKEVAEYKYNLNEPSTKIVIQGDCVEVVETVVRSRKKLKKFVDSIQMDAPSTTPLLPKDTICFIKNRGNYSVFVVEKQPGLYPFIYKETELKVSFPFHYWVVAYTGPSFSGIHLFFSDTKLEDIEDLVYVPHITNMNNKDGEYCTGNIRVPSATASGKIKSLKVRTEELINSMYMSAYNDDISPNTVPKEVSEFVAEHEIYNLDGNYISENKGISDIGMPHIIYYGVWEQISKLNSFCALGWGDDGTHKKNSIIKILKGHYGIS